MMLPEGDHEGRLHGAGYTGDPCAGPWFSWFVYSKRPFAGPKAVLTYLSRYTHRVAISNRRLIAFDGQYVTRTVCRQPFGCT